MRKIQIVNLDMSGIKKGRRDMVAKRLANAVVQYLEQLYPRTQGYKHSRVDVDPSQKDAKPVNKTKFYVYRGLIWGYTVHLTAPLDYSNLRAEFYTSSTLTYILVMSALIPALILAWWLYYAGYIAGGAVPFFVAVGLWIALGVCVWLITRLMVSAARDKAKMQQETERLSREIHDLLMDDLASHADDYRTDAGRPTLESLSLASTHRS